MNPVKGRMNLHQLAEHFKLIDDTYNANVESINAASDLLASFPGRRVLILGDMGELGSDSRTYHQEVGQYAKSAGIDDLLTIGVLSQNASDAFYGHGHDAPQHFDDREKLLHRLIDMLANEQQQISVLVKGSRSAHMEDVVADIIDWRSGINKQERA